MEQDINIMAEQIRNNVEEGQRLCRKINALMNDNDRIVASLRAVGIEVITHPNRLRDIPLYMWRNSQLAER